MGHIIRLCISFREQSEEIAIMCDINVNINFSVSSCRSIFIYFLLEIQASFLFEFQISFTKGVRVYSRGLFS